MANGYGVKPVTCRHPSIHIMDDAAECGERPMSRVLFVLSGVGLAGSGVVVITRVHAEVSGARTVSGKRVRCSSVWKLDRTTQLLSTWSFSHASLT